MSDGGADTREEHPAPDPSAVDGGPRRLHPRTVLYRLGSSGLRIGVVLLFVGLPSLSGLLDGDPAVLVGAATLVVVVAAAVVGYVVVAYRRFEYELTPDTFDIREGVLARREREIPLRRIQNVDVSQRLPQRLLGIAEVRLETAGGGSTEGRLRYVGVDEAERLQATISRLRRAGGGGADETAGDEEGAAEPLFEISPRELAVLGVVSVDLRLLSALAIAAPVVLPSVPSFLDPRYVGGPEGLIAALLGPLASLVALIAFALGASVLNTTRYVGFRLERAGDELRYERGLFQRYTGTIPLSKVQSLTVEETVLARLFGYASLTIETAGYAPGAGDGEGSQSAIPLATRDRVFALARSIDDEGDLSLSRPPTRARTRYAARYTILVALLTGGFWLLTRTGLPLPPWYSPLVGLALVPVAAHLKWRNRGYALGEDHVVTRNGFWSRERRVVPYHRVQTVFTTATVFQRRRDLATLVVDTAGSTSILGGDARAVDVDAETAASLRESIPAEMYRARGRRRGRNGDRSARGSIPGTRGDRVDG